MATNDKTPSQKVEDKPVVDLPAAIVDLLNEYHLTSKNLQPKKTTLRQIKRSIATIKDIISDLEVELTK